MDMINRYYKMAIFNSVVLTLLALSTLPNCRDAGNFAIAMVCFLIAATLAILAIMSPNFRDDPPKYEDLQKMMRGFYFRVFQK